VGRRPTLSVEVPLFDQGQGQVAKLAAEYRRAQRSFEALAVNIRSEVREGPRRAHRGA
jgi:outer membrane protein TolC